jgi:hypothetical protein
VKTSLATAPPNSQTVAAAGTRNFNYKNKSKNKNNNNNNKNNPACGWKQEKTITGCNVVQHE